MNDRILNTEEKQKVRDEVTEVISTIKDEVNKYSSIIAEDVRRLNNIESFIRTVNETYNPSTRPSNYLNSIASNLNQVEEQLNDWINYSDDIIAAVKEHAPELEEELKYILEIK